MRPLMDQPPLRPPRLRLRQKVRPRRPRLAERGAQNRLLSSHRPQHVLQADFAIRWRRLQVVQHGAKREAVHIHANGRARAALRQLLLTGAQFEESDVLSPVPGRERHLRVAALLHRLEVLRGEAVVAVVLVGPRREVGRVRARPLQQPRLPLAQGSAQQGRVGREDAGALVAGHARPPPFRRTVWRHPTIKPSCPRCSPSR